MTHQRRQHNRRSIRLRDYDYSQPGAYFITICTQEKLSLFGNVDDGVMRVNDAGEMIGEWYRKLEGKFQNFLCDEFVCMPNHVHFLVVSRATFEKGDTQNARQPLSRLVQWFKTMTTNAYIQGVRQQGWMPFPGRLWQRNYWEHVRSEDELNAVRQYIINNPANWHKDDNNPDTVVIAPKP